MTLSEIIALPDAELYAAFWIARGYEVRAFHDRFWPWCFVKNGEPISHHGYASKSDVLAHAPAPEPDVWLPIMRQMANKQFNFTIGKNKVIIRLSGKRVAMLRGDESIALMRSVLACYIYTHQPEQK